MYISTLHLLLDPYRCRILRRWYNLLSVMKLVTKCLNYYTELLDDSCQLLLLQTKGKIKELRWQIMEKGNTFPLEERLTEILDSNSFRIILNNRNEKNMIDISKITRGPTAASRITYIFRHTKNYWFFF